MSNGEELSLLPCPFCGGTAEWYDITEADEVGNAGGSCIICTKCQACGPVQFGEKDTIVDQWNRRSSPSAVEAAEAVPVAWRWHTNEQPIEWAYRGPTEPAHLRGLGYVIEPLYASPPPASPSAPQGVAELRERLINDEALADAMHAELKRQQAFSMAQHGKVCLAEAPFIDLILSAIQTSPEAGDGVGNTNDGREDSQP